MFDRFIFNKSRFDREVKESTLDNMDLEIFSVSSELVIHPIVIVPFNNDGISADGGIKPNSLILETCNTIPFNANDGGIYGKVPGGEFKLILVLPLTIKINSIGRFDILRVGDTNIDIIEIKDINILPGQTITIDTDLMIVLLGMVHDVSHITDDSVFFELDDGRNELKFDYEIDGAPLSGPIGGLWGGDENGRVEDHAEITVIWQNRWL